MAGLWIRWDCAAADNELWNELGERLGIPPAQALGHYLLMTSRLVRRRHDGKIAGLPSSALETWAGWTGDPGTWATTVVLLCQDGNGELRGFRCRNEKLIAKQLADREKRKNPPKTPDKPPGGSTQNPQETPGLTKTKTEDGGSSSSSAGPVNAIHYCHTVTGAANKGLQESLGTAFHELVSSNQTDVVAEWIRDGVPADVAARAIYERARKYKPTATRKQPQGLNYFRQVVQEAWDRERCRAVPVPASREKPAASPAAYQKYKSPDVRGGDPAKFGEILATMKSQYSKSEDAA